MKILVIADVHANLHALEAVLKDAKDAYDVAWCLGDLVGYGPYPNECIQIVRELPDFICISGNHDYAIFANMDLSTFNPISFNSGLTLFKIKNIEIENTQVIKKENLHDLFNSKLYFVAQSLILSLV